MKVLEVYTDGSASPNPGEGAWGFCVVRTKKLIFEKSGYVEHATNNQMELQAFIEALKYINSNHPNNMIYLYTDSQYVERGINLWINSWRRKWKVKNAKQWKEVDRLTNNLSIQVQWVRSHSKNKWNDFADTLCKKELLQNTSE